MAHKRSAREAFNTPKGQLSAFAVAKLARTTGQSSLTEHTAPSEAVELAAAISTEPYNENRSNALTSGPRLLNDELLRSHRPPATQLSSFKAVPYANADDEEALLVTLGLNETLAIIGQYDILVTGGVATLYGTVLRPGVPRLRVFAPSTQALPQIQARRVDTQIVLSSLGPGVRKLEPLSPLFRNIWAEDDAKGRSFAALSSTNDEPLQRSVTALEIDREMDAVLRTLSAKVSAEPRKPRIMAVGAKSSGKSTFNRVLCNHLTSWTSAKQILYLDLDSGQPEFGPPGQISLVEISAPVVGPPFTHTASLQSKDYRLIRSHTIAATSFKDDPGHYKKCTRDLIRHVHGEHPVVVNSCGWVSGLGAAVIAELVPALRITDVVLLEPLDLELIHSLRRMSGSLDFHSISRRPPQPSSRTPAERRAMQTLAYFHHRPRRDSLPRWSGKSIDNVRPWIVDYDSDGAGILAVTSYGQSPSQEFLAEVLDGSVVAVVLLDQHATLQSSLSAQNPAPNETSAIEERIDRTPDGIPYIRANDQGLSHILDPSASQCVGLALVRGIDTENKQLHLVTPLPKGQIAELLDKRVVLVRGSFDPPEWAYLEGLYKHDTNAKFSSRSREERPWVSRKEMVGIEGAVWRLRHPPMAAAVTTNR